MLVHPTGTDFAIEILSDHFTDKVCCYSTTLSSRAPYGHSDSPYLSRRSLAYYYYFSIALNLKPSRQSTPLPEQLTSSLDSQGTRRDPGGRGTGLVHLLLISDCTTIYPRSQNKFILILLQPGCPAWSHPDATAVRLHS